ncbi:MAG TPA: carbohydrate kinase family protein [Thermomicrobiales bacterium]|nr:carbohydrate kinase family protein [Thermomicrobiales bacterium]
MPRIAAIGLVDHDEIIHLDHIPGPGRSAIITRITESPGGTTANTAVALTRLGERVTLRAVVGNDLEGGQLREALGREGVDCSMITTADEPTNRSVILLDTRSGERTILWQKGAAIRRGDQLDVTAIFDHEVVILDMSDEPLRRFLTDLPAHTRPDVRLLGPITYIVDNGEPDAVEIALRFDAIVGTINQYLELLDVPSESELIEQIQHRMVGNNLRVAIVTLGIDGSLWITPSDHGYVEGFSVETRDTIGAGDAFVAGIAYGMARRWPWPEAARFANAVGALSTRDIGAQSALPSLAEVERLLSARR